MYINQPGYRTDPGYNERNRLVLNCSKNGSKLKKSVSYFIPRVPNSNLMVGLKIYFAIPQGQNLMFLPTQRVHFSREESKSTKYWAQRAKLKAFAGHILPTGRMLCIPALYSYISVLSARLFRVRMRVLKIGIHSAQQLVVGWFVCKMLDLQLV